MALSTKTQIENSYSFLEQMDAPECPGCSRGIRMCYHTPCIGTVNDMEELINAGYAMNLMLDWWTGEGTKERIMKSITGISKPSGMGKDGPFDDDVYYLSPAIIGSEGKMTPFNKAGKCNLLVDNQCSIHKLGLKPIQGRLACCKLTRFYTDANGKEVQVDERRLVLHTWQSEEGLALIERWKKIVKYTGPNEGQYPTTIPEMIKSMTELKKSFDTMYTNVNDGRPYIDPKSRVEETEIVYDTPMIP